MFAVFLLLIPLFCGDASEASVLVADNTMSRMVELNADAPFCALYTDRGVIQKMVLGADSKKVLQVSSKLVNDLERTCNASRDKGKNQPPGGGLIYPGTKWCGPGTLAKSYDELGQHAAEDACCREHDHCPITISPQECIHALCNNSPFTRSHCDCDAKFRRCLQNLNTEVANTLGALFFNVIQVTCFEERRPCSEWQSCPMYWAHSPKYEMNNAPRDFYSQKMLFFKMFLHAMRDFIVQKKQFLFGYS
ncbi:phospholipase A2 isoform X2 [Megachile rotundata]|uniref:phospholipase A2 isoform X2 n=1 Tax=Megachile rotundata TaxID=143995 RepID=UPI000614C476|nr:PREDICTED: phospholipase A2 isoform X1 [Megachile rotundata]XP_012141139.1 PREDICTED: phospholipase A2 isoform X1 [Megachile rotundata]XP_012141140.1 PREDICTED: phospholipase A2 isoform X1 [Megachile rotundata]XP_012141141.1 PREDICTED: phospholipase A2 isoform X1 [Megachile rotundata]